ncbi:TIGR04282 family arsenosugar biosynthesis glycosyltransferase [Rufibacter tibetensis]|uniref:Glycosyltransferase n=1 Tax=Rufibacter tibetensis TaxID=512763 RepID=A0A0P0CFE5_9BACT|nr:TIGR04282 family arsenosugar biosynthesis glycosyltransferase [Rufibacter tibetensis]ALI97682.1 hypothetical protein DC20_00080 [Rufibacter tibetensis]
MNKRLLLVFVRAPKLGKVKTRLASTIGNERALQVYEQLLQITHNAIVPVEAVKWVCYADEVSEVDLWSQGNFEKRLQSTKNELGHRMHETFAQGLVEGFSPIIIIGSDCPGISSQLIEEAFLKLETSDVVIGPAQDGGYYLLGINFLVPELFANIPWSTDKVLTSTLAAAQQLNLAVSLLPQLADVDEEADLVHWPQLQASAQTK